MTQKDKLRQNAINHPGGLTFAEFETLLSQAGWRMKRQSGSHRLWCSPAGFRIPVQPGRDGKAKAYQVEQFLRQWADESESESSHPQDH